MTLAYLIWCDCQRHGWDRTAAVIGESLGETSQRVARIVREKNWTSRIAISRADVDTGYPQFVRSGPDIEVANTAEPVELHFIG